MLTDAQKTAVLRMAAAHPMVGVRLDGVWEDERGYVASLSTDAEDTWITLEKRTGRVRNVNPIDHIDRNLVYHQASKEEGLVITGDTP